MPGAPASLHSSARSPSPATLRSRRGRQSSSMAAPSRSFSSARCRRSSSNIASQGPTAWCEKRTRMRSRTGSLALRTSHPKDLGAVPARARTGGERNGGRAHRRCTQRTARPARSASNARFLRGGPFAVVHTKHAEWFGSGRKVLSTLACGQAIQKSRQVQQTAFADGGLKSIARQ